MGGIIGIRLHDGRHGVVGDVDLEVHAVHEGVEVAQPDAKVGDVDAGHEAEEVEVVVEEQVVSEEVEVDIEVLVRNVDGWCVAGVAKTGTPPSCDAIAGVGVGSRVRAGGNLDTPDTHADR